MGPRLTTTGRKSIQRHVIYYCKTRHMPKMRGNGYAMQAPIMKEKVNELTYPINHKEDAERE